jgi:hypothetical protein
MGTLTKECLVQPKSYEDMDFEKMMASSNG